MTHAWFDISAGVAGDMLLGALLDAGADLAQVQAVVDAVVPGSVRLETEQVVRGGQRATKLRVRLLVDDPPHRSWATIRSMLEGAAIDERIRSWALAAFAGLAEAEGRTHGVDPETVHFHEVGALDSLADVVGTCAVLRQLGVTSVSASPVRVGSGRVRAAHGDLPVPVPAVAALVVGWQVYATPASVEHAPTHEHGHAHGEGHDHGHGHHHHHDEPAVLTTPNAVGELATPTGMAVIRALAGGRCEAMPALAVQGLGVGAGGKDFPGWPNVVRVVLGQAVDVRKAGPRRAEGGPSAGELLEVRANVDDLDPRLWPGALDAVLAAGAVDAWLVPIHMKKGRPAFALHALADAEHHDAVVDTILTHTTTLGVRWTPVARTVLDRSWHDVDVEGHTVRVKVGSRDGVVLHATPEFADVAEAARALARPEGDVLGRAQAAAAASGLVPGGRIA